MKRAIIERKNSFILQKKKGFTLVELIVVLVILAILAAILIPALLGYIDRARQEKNILEARNYKQACQTVLTQLYAQGKHPAFEHNELDNSNSNGTAYTWSKNIRREILKLVIEGNTTSIGNPADYEPYVLMYQVGRYSAYKDKSVSEKHYAYTCYVLYYQKDKNSDMIIITPEGVRTVEEYHEDRQAGLNGGRDWIKADGVKINTVVYSAKHGGEPTPAKLMDKIENGTYGK